MNPSRICNARLGDLVERVATWNPVRHGAGQQINYIDLSSIDNETKSVTSDQWISADSAPSRARQLVKGGDVLVSTVRPNLNGVAHLDSGHGGATASTGFCVLRVKIEKLSSEYLFHWVRNPLFVDDMVRKATGASYPAVSDRIIFDSDIPLPPLAKQRQIAAILDQVDNLRRKRQLSIKSLDKLSRAIFLDMFSHSDKNSPKALGDLIKVRSGEPLIAANQNGGPYPVYGGNGINGWHDKSIVPTDTIIIGRVGVYCGAVHVTDRKAWVTDNALIVELKCGELLTPYLAASLTFANLNQYAGQSAQPLVSGSRIYPVKILVPSICQQKIFGNRTAQIGKLRSLFSDHLAKIEALFTSLQHRAFQGDLTAQGAALPDLELVG